MEQPTEIAEHAPSLPNWTVEQRLRYFTLGVALPMLCVIAPSYPALTSPNLRVRATFVLLAALYSASCLGMAVCCISPHLGKRNWIQACLLSGVILWFLPAGMIVFGTGTLALLPAGIIAGAIVLGIKAILRFSGGRLRFSIKEVLLLTTLIAVLCAAVIGLVRSVEYSNIVLIATVAALGSIPIMVFGTYIVVAAEIGSLPDTE